MICDRKNYDNIILGEEKEDESGYHLRKKLNLFFIYIWIQLALTYIKNINSLKMIMDEICIYENIETCTLQ